MKRMIVGGLGVLLTASMIGVMGCDGGGIEPGMPKADAIPADALEKTKAMADMTKSPKAGPPPTTTAPAEEKK
jgi:hypothetical protein